MELVRLGIQRFQMKTSLMTAANTMEDTMAIVASNESRNQILARLGEIGKLTPDTVFGELSRRNIMALGASAGIGLGLGSISTSALAKAAKLRTAGSLDGHCAVLISSANTLRSRHDASGSRSPA